MHNSYEYIISKIRILEISIKVKISRVILIKIPVSLKAIQCIIIMNIQYQNNEAISNKHKR